MNDQTIIHFMENSNMTPYEDGIFLDVNAHFYRQWEAHNITNVLHLLKSPAHYLHHKLNPPAQTPAMFFGTAVHTRILEPDNYSENYIAVPSWVPKDRRLKERKEWEAEALKGSRAAIIESDTAQKIEGIAEAMARRPLLSSLFTCAGENELSLLWRNETLRLKGRIDRFAQGNLIDIKTCQDASPIAFGKSLVSRAYHIQVAHYYQGLQFHNQKVENILFLAIETEPPHAMALYRLPDWLLELGLKQLESLYKILAEEHDKNTWESYPDAVLPLELPDYLIKYPGLK